MLHVVQSDADIRLSIEIRQFVTHYNLSERETDVFLLLLNRITSSAEIGKKLFLSPNTVSNHLKSILSKTKTNSKTELLAAFIGYLLLQYNPYKLHARRPRVLIVDDNEEICHLIQSELKARGIVTYIEHEPARVLGRLSELQPDALVSDIVMPGMDGLTLLNEIRRLHKTPMSVVLISGFSDYTRNRCVEHGASEFFLKPFNIDHLYFVIMENFIDNPMVRNRFLRVDTEINAWVNEEHQFKIRNIAYGGCFLSMENVGPKSRSVVRVGKNIALSFRIGESYVHIHGQVAWTRLKELSHLPAGAGIKFGPIDIDDQTRIKDYVRTHKKISYLPPLEVNAAGQ